MIPHCLEDSLSFLVCLIRSFMTSNSVHLFIIFACLFPLNLSPFSSNADMYLQFPKYTILSCICAFVHVVPPPLNILPCSSSPGPLLSIFQNQDQSTLFQEVFAYYPPTSTQLTLIWVRWPLYSVFGFIRIHISLLVYFAAPL